MFSSSLSFPQWLKLGLRLGAQSLGTQSLELSVLAGTGVRSHNRGSNPASAVWNAGIATTWLKAWSLARNLHCLTRLLGSAWPQRWGQLQRDCPHTVAGNAVEQCVTLLIQTICGHFRFSDPAEVWPVLQRCQCT